MNTTDSFSIAYDTLRSKIAKHPSISVKRHLKMTICAR